MRFDRRLASCAVVAGVLTASPVLLGQDVSLRYRWTKGDALRYRITTESAVAMSGMPGMGDMTVTTTQSQVQQLTPTDVAADGTATVTMRFESVRMNMSSPMGSFGYDSAAPPSQAADPITAQLAVVMGGLVGESVSAVIAPTGAIRSLEGGTRLMEKLKKALPADAGAAMGSLGGGLDSIMSDDAMRGNFGQSFATLPDKAVKVGDTWQSEIKMPNPAGQMTVSSTFTLKAVDRVDARDVARIEFTQQIKPGAGGSAMGMMTVQMTDGTGDGEILFDHKLGRIVRSVARNTLPMTMSMTGPDGSAMNMNALTKTTVTLELVER
jgi:hypothetical protein